MPSAFIRNRLKQLNDPDLIKIKPYWQYNSDRLVKPHCHIEWDGLVLRHDDPWWKTHFPTTCHCYVVAVKPSEYKGQTAPLD